MNELKKSISSLCFSKDRPLQLEGYIRSLKKHASDEINISILYCCSDDKFKVAYNALSSKYTDVDFILETNFRKQVTRWLRSANSPLVMFGCDDVVFKDKFDCGHIVKAFEEEPNLISFSLRLGREITYCAMHGISEMPPLFIKSKPYLTWNWPQATHDWKYPFELNCSVYKIDFIKNFIRKIDSDEIIHPMWQGETGKHWGHPNRLEAFGSIAIHEFSSSHNLMASFQSAKASIITINRVQDECKNFVYDDNKTLTSKDLLNYWDDKIVLDIDSYKEKKYSSIHIAEAFFFVRNNPGKKFSTNSECDRYTTMIKDFAGMLIIQNHTLANHPKLPEFITQFSEYFYKRDEIEDNIPIQISPYLDDATSKTNIDQVYFHQDTWAFSRVLDIRPKKIIDVGSTALLVGCFSYLAPTTSIDIRPLSVKLPFLKSKKGSILDLPFEDKSVELLTSISVIEHIGLGRYGDKLDPDGSMKAFNEVERVIAPDGHFIGSVPVSHTPFIIFNAERVFRQKTIFDIFKDFELADEQFLFSEPNEEGKIKNLQAFKFATWCFDFVRKR